VTSTRTLTAAVLVVGALTAVLVGWFGSGWRAVEREQHTMLDSARAEASADAAQLAAELVAELEHLRASESQRPFFHYQNLFHDERGASEGWSVVPSPLATGPTEALVAAHFQIDDAGAVSSPTVNLAAPENNAPQAPSDLALLAELSELRTTLVEPADPVQVAMARGSPAPPVTLAKDDPPVKVASKPRSKQAEPDLGTKGAAADAFDGDNDKVAYAKKRRPIKQAPEPAPQVVQVDPDVYAQNVRSNEFFLSSRGSLGNAEQARTPPQQQLMQVPAPVPQEPGPALAPSPDEDPVPASARAALEPQAAPAANPRPRPRQAPAPAANPAPITITIAPLAWRAANLEGAPSLLAVRRVTTPDGQLTQGLVVSSERLRTWVEERDPAVAAALVTGRERPTTGASAPVVLADVGWWIVVDDSATLAAARTAAAGLRSAFLGRFIPISILAVACALLVVLLTARAEKLARQRERFAAAAAHELRTPLAGIQLYGDMLVDGLGDPAKHRDYARRVAEEASRLGRVVANVLGFSQLERRSLAVRAESGDVVEAVRAAVERAEPGLLRAGATVELDAPERATARFDRDALARILNNLLDNAEKYTREHEDRRITIAVRDTGAAVEITVADHGPGLPASIRRRRFQPFSRGIGDDGQPGLGLGLALSQSLAGAMGGELTWRDQSPGATFVVTLPAG
jgi:signal transduction histidine kinase